MSNKQQFFDKQRRHFLKKSGALVGGGLLGAAASKSVLANSGSTILEQGAACSGGSTLYYPFYDEHQAGIVTPQQKYCYFLVLNLATHDKSDVIDMLKVWTNYADLLTQGKNVRKNSSNLAIPPHDTGESADLGSHGLTLTFGVSASFLQKLGLSNKSPSQLKDLPLFPRDQLKEHFTGGDICIQSCANDPQVAFHAVRQLVRSARSHVNLHWAQSGFVSFDHQQDTPRNLFGFKDGTANLNTLKDAKKEIWIDEPGWLKGGSYLVVRKIAMYIDTWDRTSYGEQENTFGRERITGAPIGEKNEFDPLDIHRKNAQGELYIDENAHAALAHKTGLQLLRRSYSYADGVNLQTGQFDTGLLFVSYQKDPQQFIDIQNSLGRNDKLNEYIIHIGSGLFACFPGVQKGEYLGQALFA